MSYICNAGCSDDSITGYSTVCDVVSNLRKGGIARFILLDCDVVVDDVTDVSEWNLLGTSKYSYSPEGLGEFVADETTTEQITCAPEFVVDRTSGIDFVVKQFDNVTFEDFRWQDELINRGSNKQLLFVGCDGLLYYRRNWTPGEQPGFGQLTVNAGRTGAAGSVQALNIELRWKSLGENYTATPLTAALSAAIFK